MYVCVLCVFCAHLHLCLNFTTIFGCQNLWKCVTVCTCVCMHNSSASTECLVNLSFSIKVCPPVTLEFLNILVCLCVMFVKCLRDIQKVWEQHKRWVKFDFPLPKHQQKVMFNSDFLHFTLNECFGAGLWHYFTLTVVVPAVCFMMITSKLKHILVSVSTPVMCDTRPVN